MEILGWYKMNLAHLLTGQTQTAFEHDPEIAADIECDGQTSNRQVPHCEMAYFMITARLQEGFRQHHPACELSLARQYE